MSSFDKVVKLACKPKAAPPKAKYLDPLIAATWDEGGAIHDVCKALSVRLREPNAIVVFKALIVLHTMVRNGSTDNVLGYLGGSQVLRLSNVSAGNWEGYTTPENLQHYAVYLDARIKAYRDLKHDAVRVQSDSNRDARTSAGLQSAPPAPTALQRSKTLAGRKLRSMTVEKGLLRETRAVHRMLDTLVACRFYLDDLEDPLTLTALRMLVKDLLILFQAGNEGVINLLEHYFEMSHPDATEALTIYRHFCKQTELVVEYLGVARKLQNLLNVPVPNLKHAPVSLAGALQEYLDDPAFEQNRIEYRTNKEAVKRGRGAKTQTPPVPAVPSTKPDTPATPATANGAGTSNGNTMTVKVNGKGTDDMVDFFAAIEDTQSTMFNPATNSPNTAYFQQMAANPNPFQRMQAQATGYPGAFQAQPTGAFQNGMQMQMQMQNGMQGFPTGGGGLQPQAAGFNPFSGARPVSSFGPLSAQATGMGMGAFGGGGQPQGAFQAQPTGAFQQQPMGAFGGQPTGAFQTQPTGAFPLQQQQQQQQQQQPSFLRPQMTGGGAANPFRASQFGSPPMPGQPSMSAGPVMGGAGGFGGNTGGFGGMNTGAGSGTGVGLRPQMTGGGTANPFRASTMFSQGTGPAAFSVPAVPPFALGNNNPGGASGGMGVGATIPRPASAPLSALAPSSPTGGALQPVKTHQTGTRNPFGQPAPREEVPSLPVRQPTLMEIAMGSHAQMQQQQQQQQQEQQQQQQAQQQMKTQATGFGGSTTKAFDYGSSALGPGATDISGVASEFAFSKSGGTNGSTSGAGTSDTGSSSLFSSSLSGTTGASSPAISFTPSFGGGMSSGSFSPTASTFGAGPSFGSSPSPAFGTGASGSGFNPSNSTLNSSTNGSASPMSSQATGGVKAFKPSSSFGASLLEALPPIPGSAPGTPVGGTPQQTGVGAQPTGFFGGGSTGAFGGASTNSTGAFGGSTSAFGGASTNPTGGFGASSNSTGGFGGGLGSGLRPQMTGGAANPFRASMAMGSPTGPMPMGGQPGSLPSGPGAFGGANMFGGSFGGGGPSFGGGQQQPQQNGTASLI
ncbi:ANTH domain-containing protein [Mycena belliarum]|uniref:ANTH domain-containing protein n=1 Tax=Mycena belliarum TaxID=1033014 RepID=A0AAD6UCB9_9AGAR|nr:ANTH domain-containing protein [Mycena belliae]